MGPIPLRFDVADALPPSVTGGTSLQIAAWLFIPDHVPDHPVAITLLPGGSYDKGYHHAVVPGHSGYSAAEHLAALGNIVMLADHLGMGESSKAPVQALATRQICALAMHSAVQQFHQQLASGDLHPALPAISNAVKVGGGHSMGAMMTVIQQANHHTYDAILFMGYTVQGVHFYHGHTRVRAGDHLPPPPYADYTVNDRKAQHYNFYWNDVPADVIAYDDSQAVPTPSQIGVMSASIGIITAEAAQIDVPVWFGNGERDVSPDPAREIDYFPLCPNFTRYTLPRSAHCQTFAGTRQLFWNRIHHWSRGLL